jgi:hypothetical protein
MAFETNTVNGHYALFDAIRTFVAAQGWVEMQVDVASANRLIWWKAPGLSGTEEIFVGMRTYQDVAADYYNLSVFGATGYVPGNTYTAQPGFSGAKGVPMWNQPITYWAICNGQRLVVAAKIQNVYESFYLGKFLPYATPKQYPYPLLVGGMLDTESATRYSETSHYSWFKGNGGHFLMRDVMGAWPTAELWPQNMPITIRNTPADGLSGTAGGAYGLYPMILNTSTPNIWGELDGIFFISGFNNATENTMTVSGVTYLVIRDVWRTGAKDYMAMRLN